MAYYDTIYLVQGDSLPEIRLTLRDSNTAAAGLTLDEDDETTWAPLDLASATVLVKMRELGGTTLLHTIACGIVGDGSTGEVIFQFNNDELVTAGMFEGEIEVTYQGGSIQTVYDKLKFSVREQF